MAAAGLLWLVVFGAALAVVVAEALHVRVERRIRRHRASRLGKPE